MAFRPVRLQWIGRSERVDFAGAGWHDQEDRQMTGSRTKRRRSPARVPADTRWPARGSLAARISVHPSARTISPRLLLLKHLSPGRRRTSGAATAAVIMRRTFNISRISQDPAHRDPDGQGWSERGGHRDRRFPLHGQPVVHLQYPRDEHRGGSQRTIRGRRRPRPIYSRFQHAIRDLSPTDRNRTGLPDVERPRRDHRRRLDPEYRLDHQSAGRTPEERLRP